MRESELLSRIYERSRDLGADVVVGPGDDCAVVRVGREALLLTVDQLIEGRHYEPGVELGRIAHKAIGRSLSDIAAMGGRPRFALATAALPSDFPNADGLFEAMRAVALEWGCPLVGGDLATTTGPALLTVTIVGEPHASRGPVRRSTARVGDAVHVTGRLGGSLDSGRHLTFTPRVAEGLALCDDLGEDLHAMIDLSDGLGRDAGRLARASGVRLEIEAERLPLHDGIVDPRRAAADGEDYELLLTAAPGREVRGATRIGRVAPGDGATMLLSSGERVEISELGWDHE